MASDPVPGDVYDAALRMFSSTTPDPNDIEIVEGWLAHVEIASDTPLGVIQHAITHGIACVCVV